MDFRQRYENLLQILCDAYTKMYQLLEGVEQCDHELNRLSLINRPSVEEVCGVTDCKDRLIVTIDKISIAIEPIHQQLDAIMSICQEVSVHPQYRRMQNLEYVIYYAIQKIINKEDINNRGINALLEIYVKFHKEAESNPELNDQARNWFKKIEDGDSDAMQLFTWFKEVTLRDVKKIYERLDVQFDSYNGESFYNDKMQPVLDELSEKGLLVESDGAKVVKFEDDSMPPCLLQRSDGATLYATRDMAAAFYRKKTYDFYKCLYVVAYQQNLHFKKYRAR